MGETRLYEVTALPNINRLAHGRYVDIVGVTGSIPVTPTIRINDLDDLHIERTRFTKPAIEFLYIYRWDRQGRKGQRCAVTARAKVMNSIRVEFEDGYEMITSGNSIRRAVPHA